MTDNMQGCEQLQTALGRSPTHGWNGSTHASSGIIFLSIPFLEAILIEPFLASADSKEAACKVCTSSCTICNEL